MIKSDSNNFDHSCMATIKTFNNTIWEGRVDSEDIFVWLKNFDSESDKRTALYLLSRFMFFGSRQIRELLKVLFRDIYQYRIIQTIRERNFGTIDPKIINNEFESELQSTRFLGIGNPSESGTHLLYYFRQVNSLANDLFINPHEAFQPRVYLPYDSHYNKKPINSCIYKLFAKFMQRNQLRRKLKLKDPSVKRFVFIDDFAGSGHQGVEYSNTIVEDLKEANKNVEIWYLILFCTDEAMAHLKSNSNFDLIDCVYELDRSFKAFSSESRYFHSKNAKVSKQLAKQTCLKYGNMILPNAPLGYNDCQLLIGFHHNTPDNSLPIFWFDEHRFRVWSPIFPRFPKLYYSD